MPRPATFALLLGDAPTGSWSWAAHGRQAMRVADRVHVREIDDDEGRRMLRIIRRGTGSVVTCMIRRYIIWRNKHTADIRLRTIVTRANDA